VPLADGRTVSLTTGAAEVVREDMNLFESFLHAISDPTIAYILLTLGINALIFELASPGAVLPGVVGVILILLAFYSLGTLSVNLTGVLLVIAGFGLLLAEVLVAPGYGALGVGGLIALVLGSIMLMQSSTPYLAVSPYAVAGVVLTTAAFFFIALRGVVRSRRKQVSTGREGLVGAIGEARTDLKPRGSVFVEGERWEAEAQAGEISAGERVRVLAADGFTLLVERVTERRSVVGAERRTLAGQE
jgi:membrane-bound serine protease (ClpP class)